MFSHYLFSTFRNVLSSEISSVRKSKTGTREIYLSTVTKYFFFVTLLLPISGDGAAVFTCGAHDANNAKKAKDTNGANDASGANDVAVLMMLTKLWTLAGLTVLFTVLACSGPLPEVFV